MANYNETARSNYFQVKDLEKFKEWVGHYGNPDVCEGHHGEDGKICLLWQMDGYGAYGWDEDGNELEQTFEEGIGEHLVEGSIFIAMGSGYEKMRYVTGWAFAINHKGEMESISIDEIYMMAEQRWGDEVTITRAEY